jgi:hypothetical protein
MKPLLMHFINWLEDVDSQRGPCDSAFEQKVPSALVIQAEAMLQWALSTGRPVELFTTDISAKALLAGLIFRRSRVAAETAMQGKMDDGDFERLTRCIYEISHSGFKLVEGPPPAAMRAGAFLAGPLFAILAR